jgi:hypothetical protein
MNAGSARTVERARPRFPHLQTVDISEFAKADGGVTCLSVILNVAQ